MQLIRFNLSLVALAVCGLLHAQEKSQINEQLLSQARTARAAGRLEEALELCSKVINENARHVEALTLRANLYDNQRRYGEAIRDLDVLIAIDPQSAEARYRRAVAHFCDGGVKAANTDFERYLELRPQDRPYRWEYGISLYYAGRFQDGVDLFASHQTVNSNDVENAAWRYLCMARADGVEKAQRELIPIEGDARVPMKEIHALYRGELRPEDVFAAAEKGELSAARRKMQQFYAHLYVGLYYEVNGQNELAARHLREADQRQISHYMWDVAHVHVARLKTNDANKDAP